MEEGDEKEILSELKRIRARNRILAAAAALLSVLFIIVVAAAVFIYYKTSALREMLAATQKSLSEPGRSMPNLPDGNPEGIYSSTQSAGSSLTMIAGIPAQQEEPSGKGMVPGAPAAADREKIKRALSKYSDRPIVKDFLAEMKKDPAFRQAMSEKDAGNPAAMLSLMSKAKGMEKLAMKFALRRDFLPFMKELMSDPELRPLMSQMPAAGAIFGNAPRALPDAAFQAVPPESGAGLRVDSSAVGGEQSGRPAPLKSNAPPPVPEQ